MTVRLSPLDMNKNEVQNARIQNLSTAPGSPVAGQIYFNTSTNKLMWYDGSAWIDATGGAPAFGAVTAQTAYGASSGNGVASTVARSDHTHGTPALTNATPTTQAIGDAAAVGTGSAPAREDHKHAMPAFGAVTAETTFGASSGNGSAATLARSDHTHGTPAHNAAAHSGIKISDLAAPSTAVGFGSQKITSLADPTGAQDAATKAYVDSVAQGFDVKASVRAVATSNITLSGAQTIDGVSCVAGDRVLVAGQSTASTNGIYVVAAGAWSRATDADASADVTAGLFTWVSEGTTYADSGWVLTTNDPITVGSTALTFQQFSGAAQITAGTGLSKSGNTLAIDTAVVMRRYAIDVGDGSSTSIDVTHSLGTLDVAVEVYRKSDGAKVECDVTHATTSKVTLGFTVAPTSAQYRAVVIG